MPAFAVSLHAMQKPACKHAIYIYVSSAQDRLQKLRDELAQRKSERLYEQQKGKAVPSSAPRGVLVAIKSDLVLYGAPKTLSCMHIYMRCSD